MDANNNFIPIVEDDQGEGMKDIFQNLYEAEANMQEHLFKHLLKNNLDVKQQKQFHRQKK